MVKQENSGELSLVSSRKSGIKRKLKSSKNSCLSVKLNQTKVLKRQKSKLNQTMLKNPAVNQISVWENQRAEDKKSRFRSKKRKCMVHL